MLKILMVVIIAATAQAQNAVVFKLDSSDKAKAKRLYEAKIKSEKDWVEFRKQLEEKLSNGKPLQSDSDFEFAVPSFGEETGTIAIWKNCYQYHSNPAADLAIR